IPGHCHPWALPPWARLSTAADRRPSLLAPCCALHPSPLPRFIPPSSSPTGRWASALLFHTQHLSSVLRRRGPAPPRQPTMPLEQTITVVNNSGKIISTGKQLLSIFKEAKGAYRDKKAEIKLERSTLQRSTPQRSTPQRSQTFDRPRSVYRSDRGREHGPEHELDDYDYKYEYGPNAPDPRDCYYGRRRSYDVNSEASSARSHGSSSSRHHRHHRHHGSRSRPALTESNLKTLSEVSSTAPSKAPPPAAYRSPYAETMPVDMALSRMDLHRDRGDLRSTAETERQRGETVVPRRRSEPDMGGGGAVVQSSGGHQDVDMHLAYGNIPPDLAERVDLDPGHEGDEWTAHQLVHRVEGLLDEAHCLQHSASAIIKHLQEKPDAAAAVALTLAELSTAVAKMSPAFLGFLKGGSPAVFALLASPQFLIGAGVAVGVTVVMFGGWKIVKKVKEAQSAREMLLAHEAGTAPGRPVPLRTQSEYSAGIDEALVVDDELSTIETWRRGIAPFGGDGESADLELITPEADRATRDKYSKDDLDFDLRSRRSTRTHRSGKTHKSSHRDKAKEREVPERKSSRAEGISGASVARSKTSSRGKEKAGVRAIEDGRSRRGDDEFDAVFRPKVRSDNMLKAIFRSKKDKEKSGSEPVLA
ncbi:Uncharacterized protein TCAP_02392, partial [Tolypocladium capitatum]